MADYGHSGANAALSLVQTNMESLAQCFSLIMRVEFCNLVGITHLLTRNNLTCSFGGVSNEQVAIGNLGV